MTVVVPGRGRVLEHRLVMEKAIGRRLAHTEQVHHRNGDKHDNRIENLELCSDVAGHIREHHPRPRDESKWIDVACTGCGKTIRRRPKQLAWNPHPFCSRACFAASAYLREHAAKSNATRWSRARIAAAQPHQLPLIPGAA